jgi:hypothetical protein
MRRVPARARRVLSPNAVRLTLYFECHVPDAACLGIHGWNFCILDAFGRWYCPCQASATVGVCSYGPFFHLRFEIGSPLGRCLLTSLLGWKTRFHLWGRCPWYVDDQGPAQQHQRSNMTCLHVRLADRNPRMIHYCWDACSRLATGQRASGLGSRSRASVFD